MSTSVTPNVDIPEDRIRDFCRKWGIVELAVFGSVLREDFRPDSDVDVLVTFEAGAARSLLDYVDMEDELAAIVGRRVEVVNRRAIEQSHNWLRRRRIIESAHTIYAAR